MLRRICYLLLLVCITGTAKEQDKLFLYTEHFPPYNFGAEGAITGMNTDLVGDACKMAKILCHFELTSWARAIRAAESKADAGVYSTSRNAQRENRFQWVGPLVFSGNKIYRRADASHININSDSDLLNYRIGIPRGDIYQKVLTDRGFEVGKNLFLYSRKNEDIHAFFAGRLDLLLASSPTIHYYVSEVGRSVADVSPVWELHVPELKGNYLALNPKVPTDVKERLQAAIDQLRSSGQVEAITQRYIAQTP